MDPLYPELGVKLVTFAARRLVQHATPDLGDGKRGNEEVSSPCSAIQASRDSDDAGFVMLLTMLVSTRYPLTEQPYDLVQNGRGGIASALTSGDRHSASRIPLFRGGSPAMPWPTRARRRSASGPSSAKRLANERINLRSASGPRPGSGPCRVRPDGSGSS